jgi:flagellar basal body rod protein FlgB
MIKKTILIFMLFLSQNLALANKFPNAKRVDLIPSLINKIDYLSKSQQVINHNIAQANIPKVRAKKLERFQIGKHAKISNQHFNMKRTNEKHIAIKKTVNYRIANDKDASEITPSGNNIVLNDQLKNASDNNNDFTQTTKVLHSAYNMMKMAGGAK